MNSTEELIKIAAKEAIKEFNKEQEEKNKKRVFHNTKLLLRHYNSLKIHVEEAVDRLNQLETDLIEINDLDKDELYILSIRRSKSKTLIMIAHIDMALQQLKNMQINKGSLEKYNALKKYYIDEKSYEEIAEELKCGVITPRRWIKEMIEELSVILFGIDSKKFEMI
ncbi:hypothetical protein [uncultured Clostridium sp.]|mgnify:FL=1|uniref:hypothetical protein n=1 Tax=uncultured Clostridium sp. TaxID=59620 RepID=UPI0025EA873F|nr:hypothetical protein [uncultured Clostridium sp.]